MPLPDTSGAPSRRTQHHAPVPSREALMAGADEWQGRQLRSDETRHCCDVASPVDVTLSLAALLADELRWSVERPF
jgi:hypothetical protein